MRKFLAGAVAMILVPLYLWLIAFIMSEPCGDNHSCFANNLVLTDAITLPLFIFMGFILVTIIVGIGWGTKESPYPWRWVKR